MLDKEKKFIDEHGSYVGAELQWSIDDVFMVAKDMRVKISDEDAKRVLIATLQDNYDLMNFICEAIANTIEYMDEQQLINLK